MTDYLRQTLAPIASAGWKEIEAQSARILKGNLSGRKLVDFLGPFGLSCAAVNLGRVRVEPGSEAGGVAWGVREVLPLVEFRVPFELSLWELDDIARGARYPDLSPMLEAARKVALFEETALYLGFPGGGIRGLLEASSHPPVPLSPDRSRLVEAVELAILAIQGAEIGGPFTLVLGTEPYKWVMIGEPDAYPLRKRLEALVPGGIHWSPALQGGAVFSRRGGDFELTVGQDLAIGYKQHDARKVDLYFAESFTFRVLDAAAAVALQLLPAR
jgi:uncharacterized linocin/CFP29 family protein